jgi:hypothetical protein
MQHWLPYDEDRLLALLGIDRATLWRHLRDDRRTIAQLAARRGWRDPGVWRRRSSPLGTVPSRSPSCAPGRCERSTRGTSRSTSSSVPCTKTRCPTARVRPSGCRTPTSCSVCGASTSRRCRSRGNGRSRVHVERSARAALRDRADAGVRAGALSLRQARLLVARQLRQLPRWLSEAHYNGPPRTDRTGRLSEPPVAAWTAPAISGDGSSVVAEAYEPKLPLALQRGEISVVGWTSGAGATAVSHRRAGHSGCRSPPTTRPCRLRPSRRV